MNKEDLKAWLGFNLQDTLINISTIPFLIGFFVSNIYMQIVLFALTFILSGLGLVVYFKVKNQKVSKTTAYLNKWGSLLIVLIIWILMFTRVGWSIDSQFEIFTERNTPTNSDQVPNSEKPANENVVFLFEEVNGSSNTFVTYVNGYTYFRGVNDKTEVLYISTKLDKLTKEKAEVILHRINH